MSTGYTQEVSKGDDTFEDFVLRCARSFGACRHQVDDPLYVRPRIPFSSGSIEEKIARLQDRVSQLSGLTPEQIEEFGKKEISSNIRDINDAEIKKKFSLNNYTEMMNRIEFWNPPQEYSALKHFMLNQLRDSYAFESLNYTGIEKISSYEIMLPSVMYDRILDRAQGDLDYYKNCLKEEKESILKSKEWIEGLYENLGEEYFLDT